MSATGNEGQYEFVCVQLYEYDMYAMLIPNTIISTAMSEQKATRLRRKINMIDLQFNRKYK